MISHLLGGNGIELTVDLVIGKKSLFVLYFGWVDIVE